MKVTIYHEDCPNTKGKEAPKMLRNTPWDPGEGEEAYSCPKCGEVIIVSQMGEE